jgi:hypothetical protein
VQVLEAVLVLPSRQVFDNVTLEVPQVIRVNVLYGLDGELLVVFTADLLR